METTQLTTAANLTEAHQRVQESLCDLDEKTAPAGTVTKVELGERLELLRTHLAHQFRLEEADGYAEEVLTRAPEQERKVRKLLDQHVELTQSLAALSGEMRTVEPLDDALRGKVRAWVHRLRAHESQENLLIEDVFNVDCCAED
jgi:hypothetical protein